MLPFSFGKIVSGEDFTNREKETAFLIERLSGGINCMLISPRRWGKSSLVKNVALKIKKQNPQIIFCFIDLYNVRSEKEFYELYSKELLKATANGYEEIVKGAKNFFKSILPKISFTAGPSEDIEVGFEWKELKKNPSDILNLSETIGKAKKIKVVVCLDEFQNISFFKDSLSFQKKLRAHWQTHKLTTHCLYGSKRHMLIDFFTKSSMPFYKFGEILFLEKISEAHWIPFITGHFKATGKNISDVQAAKIARLVENHPYFVQQLSQAVWFRTTKKCTDNIIEQTLEDLLNQYTILYQKDVDQLTNPQLNFLKAMCDKAEQLSSAQTINEYKLGTSANIPRIKAALENKELIDVTGKQITFNDPLFNLWLKRIFFRTE